MPKIKLMLLKADKALVFQVLEQDVRFLSKGKALKFVAFNGMEVASENIPDLGPNSVYLRGTNKAEDSDCVVRKFESNAARDTYHNRMLEALRDWAGQCPLFAIVKHKSAIPGYFEY